VSGKERAKYVLVELHGKICGIHFGVRSMASKVLRVEFYWPTIRKDAKEFTKKCPECQKFSPVASLPSKELHSILPFWPFTTWAMDILDPFPQAKGQVKIMAVAVNYFYKVD